MKNTHIPPALGTPVTASGYMKRHSTMAQWRRANPLAGPREAPQHGFKTWKRKDASFSGVFVGVRVLTIKHWWWADMDTMDQDFHSRKTPITFWLIAYSHRAKPRYVLPTDVQAASSDRRAE